MNTLEQDRSCLICLEGARKDDPISLLTCGCKTSWFHKGCEELWLTHIEHTLTQYNNPKCPTCKREVGIQAKYAYFFPRGTNQKYLYNTLLLIGSECFLSIYLTIFYAKEAWLIPTQSVCIVLLPVLFRTDKDLLFGLHNVRIKSLLQVVYMLYYIILYAKSTRNVFAQVLAIRRKEKVPVPLDLSPAFILPSAGGYLRSGGRRRRGGFVTNPPRHATTATSPGYRSLDGHHPEP